MNSARKKQKNLPRRVPEKDRDEQNLKRIESLFKKLPEKKRLQIAERYIIHSSSFAGPLPEPKDFQEYNKVLPNAAERIMCMAEEEQKIRKAEGRNFFVYRQTHIYIAGLVSIGLVLVSALATWLGQAIIAVPLGTVGLAAMIIHLIREIWKKK